MAEKIPAKKGYYLLVLHIGRNVFLKIGSLRESEYRAGYYIYVGSARGPGGLRSRIKRHLSRVKHLHWHIDYLLSLDYVSAVAIVYCIDTGTDLEPVFSELLRSQNLRYIPRFGCSDKRSDVSHLYYCGTRLGDCLRIVGRILEKLKHTNQICCTTHLNTP